VINSRRVVEQSIANLKTRRILHTDYRCPLRAFASTEVPRVSRTVDTITPLR